MDTNRTITRRRFVRTTSIALAVPPVVRSTVFGGENSTPPSDRLAVSVIGCGKMAGDYHFRELLRFDDVQIVAVCEVDRTRCQHAHDRVTRAYEQRGTAKDCAQYADFRDVLARDDIDAVCIATPDHWHATPLIEACKAGKDVYCEKPLTLTIAEAKRCIDAARKYGRVVQVGSQQRSNVFGPFRQAVEIIRSGRLGKINRVTVGVGGPSVSCDLPGEEMEPGLDWDMWLGPAPSRPYSSVLSPRGVHRHFPAWRSYREFSGGGHTDMGAHHYDIAQWALDMDQSGPVRVIPPDDPQVRDGVKFVYANGVELEHGGPSGCVFYGSAGKLRIDRGHLSSRPASIVEEPLGADDVHLYRSPGHHRDWLNCVRSRQRPVADVEFGARTVTTIHLGNLAYWNHRGFTWDPENWSFGNPTDDRLLDRQRREPWTLPDV